MESLLSVLEVDTTSGLGATVLNKGSSYISSSLSKGYTTNPSTFSEDFEDITEWMDAYHAFLSDPFEDVLEEVPLETKGGASTKIKSRKRKHVRGPSPVSKTHTIRRRLQGKRRILGNRNRK